MSGARGSVPLYLGFFLLGVVGVLLGPILPELEERWQISHAEAGVLFAAQFGASASGSLLSTVSLRASLTTAYPLMALGLLILATGSWGTAPSALVLVGLGFGLCLPATNLVVAAAHTDRRGAALSTLNMVFGLGAVSCPLLLAVLAGRLPTTRVLWALALALLVAGGLVAARLPVGRSTAPAERARGTIDPTLLVALALTLFFYVGSENAIAGWVITLGDEVGGRRAASSLLLGSLFWGAQVMGRGLAPFVLRRVSEHRLFGLLLALAAVGVLIVLTAATRPILAVGTVVAGLGLSALFPLTASRVSRAPAGRLGSGWVFAFGGLGGAALPWLTGRLSGVTGSLQSAFLVPLIGLALVTAFGSLAAARQVRGET